MGLPFIMFVETSLEVFKGLHGAFFSVSCS